MPLIGFTVFKDKILSGEKTQTIRKLRKNPIIVGDHLYLYWHLRQKDCEKLGEATCTEVFQIRIDQEYSLGKQHLIMDRFERLSSHADGWAEHWKFLLLSEIGEIIRRDGFKDASELLAWFVKHYPLPEVFQVIRWDKLQFEIRKTQEMQKQIREEIHSRMFLLDKEKAKRKRKLLFPDEEQEEQPQEEEPIEEE